MEWMAWTGPTAIFFVVIALLLVTFTVLAIKFPETPRVGVLRIETTRGDRLFITLLGSAFINLACWDWAARHNGSLSQSAQSLPQRYSVGCEDADQRR